jgi:hypothetical protein
VLLKPGDSPSTADDRASAPRPANAGLAAAVVKLARDDSERTSGLGSFDPKDPFKPKGGYSSGTDAGAGDSGGATSSTTTDPSSASSPSSPAGGSTGSTAPSSPAPRRRVATTMAVDITFRAGDRSRRLRRLRANTMLPNEDDPQLIYLGVRGHGTRAVFLVNSTLRAVEGEGNCRPSRSQCGEIELEAGEQERFQMADQTILIVTVDQIRTVRRGRSRSASARSHASARRSLDAAERRRAEDAAKAAREREAVINEFKRRLAALIVLARMQSAAGSSSPSSVR